MHVKEIEIFGGPYERGLQYGKSCKSEIDTCISNYQKYIFHDTGMDWDTACKIATTYKEKIKAFNSKYIEEIRGIAHGSARKFEEILAINCRSEIRAMTGYIPADCTSVAVLPSASADNHTYTGQNWDNQTMQRDCMVIVKIHQDDAPTVMLFTEAGFVGGKGINSEGVGLLLNALFIGYEKDAVPLHIKMRAALDSWNISEAYSNAAKGPTGTGGNLMLGCDGAAISEELTLHEVDGILPVNGIITHTNHILSPRLQHINDNFRSNGSSFLRLCRIDEIMRNNKNIDKEYIYKAFSDHVGYPLGLCTHSIDSEPAWKQYSTNYTVVFDHTEKSAYFCAGNPCEGSFKRYTF
ncbi:MAG: C45 family autoproteolytic acyltransferase/hydrolase [Caldicoprobacterales bacterium]|jgi:isopenicillin-N N-acyltransferase-like protein